MSSFYFTPELTVTTSYLLFYNDYYTEFLMLSLTIFFQVLINVEIGLSLIVSREI
jgi:hypothetical protein